jgi:hypothetical protein
VTLLGCASPELTWRVTNLKKVRRSNFRRSNQKIESEDWIRRSNQKVKSEDHNCFFRLNCFFRRSKHLQLWSEDQKSLLSEGRKWKKVFYPLIKLTFSSMITRLKVFKPLFKALDLLFRFIFSSMFIRVNVFKPFKHFRSSEKLLAPGKVSASKRL